MGRGPKCGPSSRGLAWHHLPPWRSLCARGQLPECQLWPSSVQRLSPAVLWCRCIRSLPQMHRSLSCCCSGHGGLRLLRALSCCCPGGARFLKYKSRALILCSTASLVPSCFGLGLQSPAWNMCSLHLSTTHAQLVIQLHPSLSSPQMNHGPSSLKPAHIMACPKCAPSFLPPTHILLHSQLCPCVPGFHFAVWFSNSLFSCGSRYSLKYSRHLVLSLFVWHNHCLFKATR